MTRILLWVIVSALACCGAINRYYHIAATGTGAMTGDDWDNAAPEDTLEDILENHVVAGDVLWIKDGTYALGSAYNSSARNGTATAPIALIGVKAGTTRDSGAVVYADWSRDSSDRPFFDLATYTITTGNYYHFANMSFEGSAASALTPGTNCAFENCRFGGDGAGSSNQAVVAAGQYNRFLHCEFTSPACGRAMSMMNTGVVVLYSYFHDVLDATYGRAINPNTACSIYRNVFYNSVVALNIAAQQGAAIVENTFVDCDQAITGTTGGSNTVAGNVVDASATDGFKWTTQTDDNTFWGNHGNNNRNSDMWDGVDETTCFQDFEVDTGNPLFADTSADNFSLLGASPCLRSGNDLSLGVGTTVINGNKGAWQGFPEALRNTSPVDTNVIRGVTWQTYNVADTGRYYPPAVGIVQNGKKYGVDSLATGTYSGGGGGGTAVPLGRAGVFKPGLFR